MRVRIGFVRSRAEGCAKTGARHVQPSGGTGEGDESQTEGLIARDIAGQVAGGIGWNGVDVELHGRWQLNPRAKPESVAARSVRLAAGTAATDRDGLAGAGGRTARALGRERGVDAMEVPAPALGVLDGLIGLGHGAQELDPLAVFLADVLVDGHGES